MVHTTPLESRPPESGTPTGASEMRCRATTRSKRAAKSAAYSSSLRLPENSRLTSGFQ